MYDHTTIMYKLSLNVKKKTGWLITNPCLSLKNRVGWVWLGRRKGRRCRTLVVWVDRWFSFVWMVKGLWNMVESQERTRLLSWQWHVWCFFGCFFPVRTTTITLVTEGLHRSRGAGMVPNHMRRGFTKVFFLGSSHCHLRVLETWAPFSPSYRCLICEGVVEGFYVSWKREMGEICWDGFVR